MAQLTKQMLQGGITALMSFSCFGRQRKSEVPMPIISGALVAITGSSPQLSALLSLHLVLFDWQSTAALCKILPLSELAFYRGKNEHLHSFT